MRWLRHKVIGYLATKGIYVYRKAHESDFLLRKRIQANLISRSNGILHIGAHLGQEADFYSQLRKPVIWIEALPHLYEELKINIAKYPNQKAICALLGEENNESVKFHVANNEGASSSIYEPNLDLLPPFKMQSSVDLPMNRLDRLFKSSIMSQYDHWVVDVQGAELSVISGAGNLIDFCNSIVVEGKEDSYYLGGTKYSQLESRLESLGFMPLWDIEENVEDNIFYLRVQNRRA